MTTCGSSPNILFCESSTGIALVAPLFDIMIDENGKQVHVPQNPIW